VIHLIFRRGFKALLGYWVRLFGASFFGVASALVIALLQAQRGAVDAMSAGEIGLAVLGGAVVFAVPVMLVASLIEPFVRPLHVRSSIEFKAGCTVAGGAVAWLAPLVLNMGSSRSLSSGYEMLSALALIPYGVLGGLVYAVLAGQTAAKEVLE
jgi:hypothetical protein